MSIVKDLWENESDICSFICDMQQLNGSFKSGYFMFFLEALLVPPTKFRPAAVAGDSVSIRLHDTCFVCFIFMS